MALVFILKATRRFVDVSCRKDIVGMKNKHVRTFIPMYEFIIFIKGFTVNKEAGKTRRFYRHRKYYMHRSEAFL